jgi:hypothetical protein
MYAYSSSPTLSSLTISANLARVAGGGAYNYQHSSPSITNVTVTATLPNTVAVSATTSLARRP